MNLGVSNYHSETSAAWLYLYYSAEIKDIAAILQVSRMHVNISDPHRPKEPEKKTPVHPVPAPTVGIDPDYSPWA